MNQIENRKFGDFAYLKESTMTDIVSNVESFSDCLKSVKDGLKKRFNTPDFKFLSKITQILENPLNCKEEVVIEKFVLK